MSQLYSLFWVSDLNYSYPITWDGEALRADSVSSNTASEDFRLSISNNQLVFADPQIFVQADEQDILEPQQGYYISNGTIYTFDYMASNTGETFQLSFVYKNIRYVAVLQESTRKIFFVPESLVDDYLPANLRAESVPIEDEEERQLEENNSSTWWIWLVLILLAFIFAAILSYFYHNPGEMAAAIQA